jgi:hypothetical protein
LIAIGGYTKNVLDKYRYKSQQQPEAVGNVKEEMF